MEEPITGDKTASDIPGPDIKDYKKLFGFLLLGACAFLFITLTIFKTIDADIWYHLKTGEYIYQRHSIPKADIFSWTASGNRWITHEWLSELLFYLLYRIKGINGLIIFKALLILLTYSIVYRIARLLKAEQFLTLSIMSLAILFAGNRFDIRVHLFTDFFLSILLLLLVLFNYKQGISKRTLWLLVAGLFFAWAQFHSGFIFGFFIIGIFIIGEFLAKNRKGALPLVLALFIAVAASLVNPNGYRALIYPFSIMQKSLAFQSVTEYLSPFSPVHRQGPVVYAFTIFLALGALSFLNKDCRRLTPALVFFAFALLSLRMIRNISLFAVVSTPFIAANLTYILNKYKPRLLSNFIFILTSITLIFLLAFNLKYRVGLGVDREVFPEKPIAFLEANAINGPMFNSYSLGGYIIWRLFPKYKVFIDGRNDVYDPQVLEDYNDFMVNSKSVEEILKRRNIAHITIKFPETNINTIAYLLLSDNWGLVFFDMPFMIFVKNSGENAPLLKNYAYDTYLKLADTLSGNAYLWQLAVVSYQRAIAITETAQAYLKLATLYDYARRAEEAKQAYLEVIRLDTKNIIAYTNLGSIYAAERDFAKAYEAWQKAAELDANSLAAQNLKLLEQMMKENAEKSSRNITK